LNVASERSLEVSAKQSQPIRQRNDTAAFPYDQNASRVTRGNKSAVRFTLFRREVYRSGSNCRANAQVNCGSCVRPSR